MSFRWPKLRTINLALALMAAGIVSGTQAAPPAADRAPATKPRGLTPGDTIMMVAPAGELIPRRVQKAVSRLEEMGYKVIVPDDLFEVRGYLAGPDERRAAELMRAFTDPEVDAVFPGTGGYGTMRILDLLDFDAIRANPKVFIGFSDVTGLHEALATKCNLVTFHSPNPQWGLGSDDNLPEFSAQYFWRCLLAEQNKGTEGFAYEAPRWSPLGSFAGGVAEGPLCGGNLSLIASLSGSEYQLDTTGKVIFLEDVNEAPYRIDRMLRQLKLSGQLDAPAGILLGQFRKCEADGSESSLSLTEVFLDYFADAPYPVVCNFPAGHVTLNATLPLGVPVRIDAERGTVRVLENPVQAR
ncbi:S66 peptidase family protein [Botrimarina hoheduenensis]|uniref:Putative murein peptide carboxypeptidase n=1 Tax=Botrimarina hoheduenensis TaxID=2528000 RepID=A0A5C5WF23_9BACT|nr:LD-carboxypeptidase [Botrimarina hoheduenensis]TWT48689.1 putative murein peptide carboxypeptidase [Botrimarina hoheduenensis]